MVAREVGNWSVLCGELGSDAVEDPGIDLLRILLQLSDESPGHVMHLLWLLWRLLHRRVIYIGRYISLHLVSD